MDDLEVVRILSNSTILITGSSGMIGQNIVDLILRMNTEDNAQINIIAHGRDREKINKLFGYYIENGQIEPLICDIADIGYKGKVDYIIHTASTTGGSKQHLDYPLRTLNTAIDGTRKVLELAKDKQCKGIVFLSSLEVYGNTGIMTNAIRETDGGYIDTMNPRSSYSEGKRISECFFAAYAKQYGIRAIVARLTASFGAGASIKDNRVFAQFARSIIEGKDIVLKSSGKTVRDYCDATDVGTALIILLAKGESGQAYNVANMNTTLSIRELAQRFIDLYPTEGSKLVFEDNEDATRLGYNPIMRNVLDSSKLMRLGWEPKYRIDDMIVHLVESFRRQQRMEEERIE